MSEGLGVDGYRAVLMQFVQEAIAASGKSGNAIEIVGRMLYEHGFDGLFDQHDKLRVDVVVAALQQALPPEPVAPNEGPSNNYGFASEADVAKLDPLTRMKLADQAKYDASIAAKREADEKASAITRAKLPPDWDEWRPERKLEFHYAQQRSKNARAA